MLKAHLYGMETELVELSALFTDADMLFLILIPELAPT